MKILAADTSTAVLSIALCEMTQRNDAAYASSDPEQPNVLTMAEATLDCGRVHTERLLEVVDWLLGHMGIPMDAVDLLAISKGPGSFTGLRVGVAAWKGLALSVGRPLIGVPTLDAMTRLGPFFSGFVCPLLDARMKEVFGAVYRFDAGRRSKVTPDLVCPVDDILNALDACEGPLFFLGDGAKLYQDRIRARFPEISLFPGECVAPKASAVAREGAALWTSGAPSDAALLTPVYLRKSQAEEARKKATLCKTV